MICRDIKKNLHLYIGNELDNDATLALKMHLDECPHCSTEYESLTALISNLNNLDEIPPVSDTEWKALHDAVLESIHDLPTSSKTVDFPRISGNIFQFTPVRAIAAGLILTVISFGILFSGKGLSSLSYPKIVAISGNAYSIDASTSDNRSGIPAEENLTLSPGRTIHTDKQSTLQIRVDKKTTLELGNNSKFSVSDCKAKRAVFKLKSGDLAAKVSKRKPDQLFRIETPNAYCEVVGTRFNVSTHHDKFRDRYITTLAVSEGVVNFGSAEKHIAVTAGHAIAKFGDSLGNLTSVEDSLFKHLLDKPLEGFFTVASNPADAQIIIDGETFGTTPCSGSLPFGKHSVICRKDGFIEWTGSLLIDSYSESTLDIRLSLYTPELKNSVKLAGYTEFDFPALKNAHALLLAGNYKQALDLLEPVSENSHYSSAIRAAALNKMSMCFKYSGRFQDAVSTLSRIINGSYPHDQQGNALFERASIYLKNLQDGAAAYSDFKRYTTEFSDGFWIKEATLSVADYTHRHGNYTAAAQTYQNFCDTYKGCSLCENALFTLGMIYANNLSEPNRAITVFNRLQLEYPQTRSLEDALFWSADCLLRQGQTRRALSGFENYTRRFPDGKWKAEVTSRLKKIETAGVR